MTYLWILQALFSWNVQFFNALFNFLLFPLVNLHKKMCYSAAISYTVFGNIMHCFSQKHNIFLCGCFQQFVFLYIFVSLLKRFRVFSYKAFPYRTFLHIFSAYGRKNCATMPTKNAQIIVPSPNVPPNKKPIATNKKSVTTRITPNFFFHFFIPHN